MKIKFSIGNEWIKDCSDIIDLNIKRLNILKGESSIKKILEIILTIGNFLNSGNFKGNALGFAIDGILEVNENEFICYLLLKDYQI
jgi:hypothetical protein